MAVVAVIGASADRHKFGNKALRAFRANGYTVIPINPHETVVEGERAYASVFDYPGEIDHATVYVQPSVGATLMAELARKRIKTVWLNPGADAPAVVAAARAAGLKTKVACSITGIGDSPSRY